MRALKPDRAFDAPEQWLVASADVDEAAVGLASLPLSSPAFFLGWACVGVLLATAMPHTAEDRRLLRALGVGLGPLMAIVAAEARSRRRGARPVILADAVDHGGGLDVLVLVQHHAHDVDALGPTLEAVATDIATVTVARAVPDLSLGTDPDDALGQIESLLRAACDRLPVDGAGLVVFADASAADAARHFTSTRNRLVLHAVGDTVVAPGR